MQPWSGDNHLRIVSGDYPLQKFILSGKYVAHSDLRILPNGHVIEDIIDVLHLTREVVKSVAGAWEIVEQTQIANEIDLPFLKRKEQKIILRMAELSHEIRASEMMVSFCCL